MAMTWSEAVRVHRLELLDEALELALRAPSNSPFEVSRKMRDDMLACIFSREPGSTKDDEFIRTRRHDAVLSHLDAKVQRRLIRQLNYLRVIRRRASPSVNFPECGTG
jgi:hypothetical protein